MFFYNPGQIYLKQILSINPLSIEVTNAKSQCLDFSYTLFFD